MTQISALFKELPEAERLRSLSETAPFLRLASMPETETNNCRRCGSCCLNGGPALHREDIALLRNGRISHADLVTIRCGEPAYSPLVDRVEPSALELVKLAGMATSWSCHFFSTANNCCRIYEYRPLECRLLNCREPGALLEVIGKQTISRRDLINTEDPVCQLIDDHERRCTYTELNELTGRMRNREAEHRDLDRLSELLQEDIEQRHQALEQWLLPAAMEMFIFGRPLFLTVQQMGITVVEENGGIKCRMHNAPL